MGYKAEELILRGSENQPLRSAQDVSLPIGEWGFG